MKITTVKDKRIKTAIEAKDPAKAIKGWNAKENATVREQITAILAATHPLQLNNPSWHVHELKPGQPGVWSLRVTKNFRLTFRFDPATNTASELSYLDYH